MALIYDGTPGARERPEKILRGCALTSIVSPRLAGLAAASIPVYAAVTLCVGWPSVRLAIEENGGAHHPPHPHTRARATGDTCHTWDSKKKVYTQTDAEN